MGKFAQLLSEAGLRKVGEHENGTRKATIHHNSEYDEYQVKFHKDGKHQKDADYHTDNKEDAHGTAKHWVNSANEAVEVHTVPVHKLGDAVHNEPHNHMTMSAGDKNKISGLKHGESSEHRVIDSNDKSYKIKATAEHDQIHVRDNKGNHLGVIHKDSLNESTWVDGSKFGSTPETQFHKISAMPHKGGIRINGTTKNTLHGMKDGKTHNGEKGSGHLVTAYSRGDHKDAGTSHFTIAHREGDVVHLRDKYTGKHVATVSHADLSGS